MSKHSVASAVSRVIMSHVYRLMCKLHAFVILSFCCCTIVENRHSLSISVSQHINRDKKIHFGTRRCT